MAEKNSDKEKLFYVVCACVVLLGKIIGVFPFAELAIFTLIAIILVRYNGFLYILVKTLPRDLRFASRAIKVFGTCKLYEMKNMTGIKLFREKCRRHPHKVCFYFKDEKWTFAQVEEYSNRIANVFQAEGYKKGDVVGLLMLNKPEFVCTWLGLSQLGVITSFLNTNLRDKSLLHCINVASMKGIIYTQETSSQVVEISDSIKNIKKYVLGGVVQDDGVDLSNLLVEASTKTPVVQDEPNYKDIVIYIYTSGTTGLPKAAVIPNSRLLMISLASYHMLALRQDDIVYDSLPLYHTAGGLLGVTCAVCHGVSVVIREKFSASNFWPDCIKYKCTVAQYIGEMCRYILTVPPRPEDKQHHVRQMIGNGMRPALWEEFVKRFNVKYVCELYGSTEGNANIINIDKKVGAIGFIPTFVPANLLPLAIIKVDESGNPIRDKNGLCIRCKFDEPGMFIGIISKLDASKEFHGYVGNKTETSKKIIHDVFKKGTSAFLSGDLVVMDKYGYLYFKDRTGDTFRWKGENVSTAEVEDVIINSVGMKEVTVYGVQVEGTEGRAGMATIVDPDKKIKLTELAAELEKSLPSYARPFFLRIATKVDNMTGTFKLKKFDLQKQGYDPSIISDDLYFRNGRDFIPLSLDVYNKIKNGEIRL